MSREVQGELLTRYWWTMPIDVQQEKDNWKRGLLSDWLVCDHNCYDCPLKMDRGGLVLLVLLNEYGKIV